MEHLELKLLESTERKKAFEGVVNYCDKIKFLHLSYIYDVPELYELIIHTNKHLKYLTIQNYENDLKASSMILKGLGQILSDSLEYLNLIFVIDPNDLKIFLDNCKHDVGLNKLLLSNYNFKDHYITFNVLKEFVREKKIKDFAYQVNDNFDPKNIEHCKLDKLVGEVQDCVKLKRYSDIVVNFDDLLIY